MFLVGSFAAYGQATSGNIAGTVVDKSGAAIANATVTATNDRHWRSDHRAGQQGG